MTLTDYKSRNKEPPEWVEEDQTVLVQGRIGEDIIIELKFASAENYDDLQFELIRDGLPISSDRYRLSMRGNIVQLALKQSRKNDTGYYSLVATRLGQEKSKSAVKKIHLSVNEQSYEDGEPPVFLRRLSDLAVKVGTRTRFLVEIRSPSTLKITWYKDDSPLNDGPRFSFVHEGNFHCVDVAPVRVEDQGSWTCMAENRSGRSSCTSTLTVIVPKAYKKPEFVEELRALLTETGTVSLECKVVGVPTPVLRWFKDSKEIKAGDVFALTANPDDPTSLGVYTCEAVNCMGTAYSSSKVHVVGRGSREGSLKPADTLTPSGPLPVFKQFLQDECCRIGDNLSLSCRVQVPPWPKTITWYNKGGLVESSEKYHIIEDGIGGYSIEVKQVEAVDEGEWKCVATSEENMKQFSSCYVAMSIPRNYRKPRFMENLKAVLTEEGLVSFECKVVGFPTPLLRWFKDGQELKPGDVYQLTGTNSLGSYCCIARNCMGEAKSTAELTIEDIQNQLNEEERFQLLSINQPPKFIKGLRSCEARINENFRFTIQVSIAPEPALSWYRDDALVDESDKYHQEKETLGTCHFEVRKLEFIDQAEWKCVAANDFGHSVTSCFLKLIIPKHYKKPIFLESLRAILSEEGAVNLECKVIGVPQPVLKWYKDNVELKPGDIHRIISGQDGTCCLGVYTCEATNCMGTVSSSASLLGFEEAKAVKQTKEIQSPNGHELARNLSLSTIHEERTSQLYDTPQTDHSVTLDERGEVSFSFDGKEVSVSLYETPDLTEEEALQIVEMYADQLSEHVTEHNVIELPPMRFVKESSTSGNLLMEAVVIDVSPDYFVSAEDDLRTEADVEDVSIMDDVTHVLSSPERDSRSSLKRSARYNGEEDEKAPSRPPRKKSMSVSSSKSERSQRVESESFHSAQKNEEPPLSPPSSSKQDDSDTFADALSSAHLSITESLIQKKDILEEYTTVDNRKRSLSAGRSTGSSLDDGIGGDSSFDSVTGVPKRKKQRRKRHKDKSSSEEYSGHSDGKRRSRSEDEVDTRITLDEPVNGTELDVRYETEQEKLLIKEELLDDVKGAKEVANIPGAEEIEETMEDILLESRVALCKALKACEKMPESLVQRFSNIYEGIDDMHQILEVTQRKNVETLNKLEKPLHALLNVLGKITSVEEIEIIRTVLEPSILHLSDVVENLGLPSLQSTLTVLNKVNERICNIPSGTEKVFPAKSTTDASGIISEEIVDPLIDIQSTFSAIVDYIERSKLTKTPQQASKTSALAVCLTELRECASHTAHTAMTFKENETLHSLMEFKEPLLDLQSVVVAEEHTPQELPIVKEITLAIKKLKCVVVNVLKNSGNPEALSRAETILAILEDTDKQILQLVEQLLEIETAQKQVLKNLNIDQSLSNVHFALSSVLEKQEEHAISSKLITCIETLRQAIGSSAVTIASLKSPVDEEITREISRLKESLLNLQRDLLTEKHEPEEEEILNNLMSPISRLKDIIHSVIERSSPVESMVSILQLLKEIERDATLVAKEISKKKSQKESDIKSRVEETEEKNSSNLASQINRSLHPIKHWLSTSEDSTKDEMESELSSTVEELKRDVTQIAIQTSYSEPPSDKSLIEALIDLREPLMRLKNAISIYHGPEDLSTLENLDRPMKHLLQTIMDVLQEHANEVSLLPIIDIVQQIENQLPLSIKDALYQQELKQSAKTSNIETEEDVITASRETIPDTLTEIASTPLESTALPSEQTTEQITTEDDSKKTVEIVPQIIKSETQEREKNANKLITSLSETLEKLQLEMTGILEDFEESTAQSPTISQSKLANSLEELRRTISTIRMMTTTYGKQIGSSEEKVHQATLVLINLTQPLMNIRELLSKQHKHDMLELMILNQLTPLLNAIENNVIRPATQFANKDAEKEYEFLLRILEEIKAEVPNVVQEISSRRKILEYLRDISKPLENIMERMKDLEQVAEETLETDVAKILRNPIAILLKNIKTAIQEADVLDRRESMILELRNLLEPLQEFHSCLSMVQSSRKSLVPEACLLEERRSVILRAIDGLQKQICHTVEAIANMEEALLFNESLIQLNSAILKVQKQIGKTDYSRRSSSVKVPLQHRLTGTLSRLANAIIALEEHADKDTHEVVSKCLEALQKQISFTQMQFTEVGSESVDEEAIVEGFLYPTSQILSALNVLKDNIQKTSSAVSHPVIVQLQELADSISELSSSLSVHKTELVQEGASNEAPIVETFSAVIDVLNEVKDSIAAIEKVAEVEQKASVIITEVESITDEIIEISQEEIETIMVITEASSVEVVQEVAESKIEDAPQKTQTSENLEIIEPKIQDAPQMTQTSVLETSEITIRIEQEANLADMAKHEETQEKEKKQFLITQMSKFNSAINSLIQPLQELSNFIKSATQESLVSKSDEDRRNIQELTALMQIIYDLQATNTSIKTYVKALLSISTLLDSDFSRMENILVDLEQAVSPIIFLTNEGVKPELKGNIMVSLQSFVKPLNNLENILESICQTIVENKHFDESGEMLVATARTLIPYINDIIKCLKMIQIPKNVQIVNEKETESKIKEETKNIEETTARPLEELIEAIMDSQEQVKYDKTLESSTPSADLIDSKDDLKLVEIKGNEIKTISTVDDLVKETDNLSQNTVDTSQQALISLATLSPIEERVEKKEELNFAEECLEEVKEVNFEITEEKIETLELLEKDTMQKEQVKIEMLQVILSPLQVLHKSFDKVGEMGILESSDGKTVAFSTLLEPLLNLELASFEDATEMKQSAVTPQNVSVVCILEELQKSIATVQEQVQLYTAVETSPNETTKMCLIQAVEKPLEDLKMSLASIQCDPTICEQSAKLLDAEQVTVLQTVVKSVEEFGEKFMSIIDQVKAEEVSQLQIAKQEEQTLDPEILRKIIDPIHILHETLSQIEDLHNHKAELLEIRQEKKEIIQLNAVLDSLKKLEQLLITDVQHVANATTQDETTKNLKEHQILLVNADLKPVLEELKTSIIIVHQQAASIENNSAIETLSKAFEGLKMPLTVVEEILDHSNEVTETEKVTTLLSFAKSLEETNQLVTTTKQDVAQEEDQVTSLLKTIIIPIEGLQSTILELEDQVSQTMETKESVKVVALERMVQPLQELQQSFLATSHQEIALSLQRLPIKPVLDNLNKSIAEIQEQVAIVQDNVAAKATSDDVAVLKDFARSLSNLRTSTVVLQQLNMIENASQQIVEIENASALQAFAKSVEEFRKYCSVVVERPKIVEAFATGTKLKQPTKVDTQLLESIITPLRILQEQILTIEETKMQESEILDVEMKTPVNVLSSLVGPLQQLEKSFVATVHKEQVIEHDGYSLASDVSSADLEKLALQPILEEVQKSIATVQEHIVFEAGSHITSETETDALLKSIAQPLVDLKASIASIQQVTAIAPDSVNELAQQNVSALETFAETLHNLSECIAMCNHQQIVMEPAADTISEGASSLNTWADLVEEPLSKVTRPMVIDQGAIESPAEIVMSISEDETSALRTLAKPLTELRECLAIIVDERKVVAPSDTTRSLSEKEDISLLKTMIQPLLELNDAATAVIQEQMAIERTKEHSFEIEGNNEFVLRPLIEPLEELRHSIAVIQDQMLVETSTDRQRDNVVLDALAEPLFDLQRAISVLEARVMSPDVQSIPEDTSSSWITECLAIPLHEIERSIADIRQCTIIEPKTIMTKEQVRATPDWSIVEKLEKPVEGIKSVISRMEDNSIKIEVLEPMAESLNKVQKELSLLKNTYTVSIEEQCFDAIIDLLSNLENCILFVKKEIDKPKSKLKTKDITTLSSALTVPLIELECCIVTAKKSPNTNLGDLERPLELVQNALQTVLSTQRTEKFSDLSMKVANTISDINTSIKTIENKLEQQQISILEVCIESEALRMLTRPLQNIKQCMAQIQEKPSTADLMIDALQNLEKSLAVIREQSADKPLAEPHHIHFPAGFSKCLVTCLSELQESIETSKPLWREETALEGLTILDEPIYKLKTTINIICDQILEEKEIWIDTPKLMPQKKAKKKEKKESEVESVKKDDKTIKVETEDTKLKDKDLPITMSDKENEKKPDEKEKESEKVPRKEQIEEIVKEKDKQTDIEKEKIELKIEEKTEIMKKLEEEKEIKDKQDKESVEYYAEKNKIEELKKENNQKEEKESVKASKKKQKHIKIEETDKTEIQEEKNKPNNKTKDKEEKQKKKEIKTILEEQGKKLKSEKTEELKEKHEEFTKKGELMQENLKEEKQERVEVHEEKKEQKKQEVEEKVNEVKEEITKSEKIEELIQKQQEIITKEESIQEEKLTKKEESVQEKVKKEKQKQVKVQEQKKLEVEEKVNEVKEEITKSEKIEELKKKQKLIKKEESIQEEKQNQIYVEEQKKQEVEGKVITEKGETTKNDNTEELEKKQEKFIKKEEPIQENINQEEQKQQEEVNKIKIEDEDQNKKKAQKITKEKEEENKKIEELQKENEVSKQDQEKKIKEEVQQKKIEKIKEKDQKEKKEIKKLDEQDKTKSEKPAEVEKKKVKKEEIKQEEKKIEEKIKKNEKVGDEKEKTEDLEKKKSKIKEESIQEKITKKEQTDQEQVKKVKEEIKEQEEKVALKKAKEEKDEPLKEKKATEVEKKINESSKSDTPVEKITEEKIDKIKISKKEDEEQYQIFQTEEIKAKDTEAKPKKDVREKKIFKKNKQEDTVEAVKEEPIKEKEEDTVKTKEAIQHIQSKKSIDDTNFQRRQEKKRSCFEEIEESKRKEENRQWKLEDNENWLRAKENEQTSKSDKYKIQKEKTARAEYDNKRLYEMEIERLEKRRPVERSKKKEADYIFDRDEEKSQRRNEETRIRRDETARFLREEEQRLRRRHEEEMYRNKQRREEQIKESQWSRRRENETDRFLKNMLENRYKSDKLTAMFFDDYHRDYISRLESGIPTLTSSSRSYSWRESLTSLNRKLDDYWDYKLRGSSTDKHYYDTGSSYRRRRKRENRMIRARSISLMKYEDYSTDSDATIVPITHARSTRRTKVEAVPRVNFDAYELSPFSYFDKSERLSGDKPKKPSFCTKLTNRTVGVGMRIRLTCTVLGNPEPCVYWTKDGYRLDASDNRCRTRYENGMAYLELHNALPEDAGLYTCIAENAQGTSNTESTLRVYSDYKPTHSPPTFVKSIKDSYRHSDRKLILECRVRAHPTPSISWLKDGQILQGERYRQSYLDDDVYRLEISDPNITDNGQYTCRAINDLHTEETSHMVHVEDWRSLSQSYLNLSDTVGSDVVRRPRFSNLLKDYSVPTGGTIALQVEVKGVPPPEVKWLRGDRKEPIAIPKARTFTERGLHTLIVPEATESERGTYVCRAINAYGQIDTAATVDVISGSAIDGGKPAVFVSRPSKKLIDVIVGEDVSISFRVSGVPKPRVIWMKGLTDITDGPRSYKETIDDYVRLTLKRALPFDEGTYCILVKNRYGCDRSFFSIKVKQRARSLTPSDWESVTERDAGEEQDDDMSYIKNVPGPISSEPVAVDGGKNWLSLTWGKAERRGPAPVIAYKVDAWQLGSDGGARWVELGITPINAFDAFNLRPSGEYKFRVTPRNRYGWGEPVTMTNSVTVSESTDLPEFTKILPGQLKALEGTPVKLECEVRGDSKTEVRWYRETTEIDARNDPRYAIHYNGSRCSLTIASIREDDSGRYVCEASNKIGKMSSFARVLVVTDPRIIEADAKLRTTNLSIEPEDRPPQFTMRVRDRRVQTTYPVRLTCQVTGHPIPEITWHKDGTEISQDDRHIFWDDDSNFHTLEIIHSTLDDSGCYMVTARNINGSVSCRCNLVVDKGIRAYIAPEFLRGLDAVYTIHPNEELRLSAQLEAYPSVGVVWHRDGIRLRPSRRAVMTLSHDGTVQFSLASVAARDAGVYSCTATNVVGHAETSTRVAVIAAQDRSPIDESAHITSASPDIPYSKEPLFVTKPLSTEAIEGDTVIILCEVVGDPKPEVIWLRDFLKPDYYRDAPHFRLVGAGPQYRLEIPYAKLDFTGTYSVIARNCHGEAKAVISLQIYAKGQGKEERTQKFPQGKVLTLPIIKRELRDLRCCDGDAVSLECKVHAAPEPPLVRWERGGKIIAMVDDFASEFDGETARLSIQHVYPEDEGEYTCVAYNDLGKAYTSACLVVDVPEGKENILSQRLTRPVGLLSAGSTPRSTPRSTPIRSLSPAVPHGREFRSPQVLPRSGTSKKPKICPPKFYAVPHNRLVQEGETVRFQCAVVGHPAPWVRWDKNGTIVTPSARISIKERDDVKILEIVDVMREDAALYRVTAENDFGRIEASARLEVISRYESTSRTIRTRSASPRTYPSFDRSLLPTTSRINGRLHLECRIKGSPSVTPTWYRNGRPLERSGRIKRHFDGATAKLEISKVKASDAGEYTCVATNVLGSTRSSCQVTVLDPYDSSTADKSAPRFVQTLPKETIVMENYCHEFQTGITGTPPFTVTWSKDGRELPDNDYYKHIIYGDGGVALRLSEVRPQDAGEYTCVVRNDFGAASCTSLFAVQDYKEITQIMPQFTKTPLSVTAVKGSTAYFCARVQCGKTTEITWTINGKDARDNMKCKIEKDGNVSILKIRDVSSRDTGEFRCTASVNGKGPSVSCVAKLRLQRSLHDLDVTKPEDAQFHANFINVSEKILERSSFKRRRQCERSPSRVRSSSFPRQTVPCAKGYVSPLAARKRIPKNASSDVQKSRLESDLSAQRNTRTNLDKKMEVLKDHRLSLLDAKDVTDVSTRPPSKDVELLHNQTTTDNMETLEKAAIIKEPADVTVFKGNKAVLRITYRGRPEPTVKWLRVNRELRSDEKTEIVSGNGASCLTLDNVTYDHAGKYEVSVENSLGKERRYFSLAVEGPPEPPADKPGTIRGADRTTIVWRSPPYDGGRTVTGYTVEARRAGESTWTIIAESCHSLSHTTETNFIIPGESYRFRVRAENVHGLSEPGMESDPVRIPKEGETMLQEENEDEFEPSFEARVVEPEEGKLFDERYEVLEELGKGRYGVVKRITELATGTSFAAKFVRTIKTKDREQVREEIRIMNVLRHPKLLLLAAAYESPRETVLVTEYISGGELFERVVADDFTLTEWDSILFMRQICEGVEYMHKNKIVHLDLKPENIMCRTRTSHQIKLIDFGLAQTLKPDTPIRVLFGTPEFIPPEIISYEPIGTESDMWSVGVICYVLLTGLSPFMGDNDAETFANITRADYDLDDEAFDAISNNAKDFISNLLIKRKELRMSAVQCLEHPWMAEHNATVRRVALPTEKLKKFIIRRKWQKTGNAIRALGRMAILSAHSRRSPTSTAESSPTFEQRPDIQDPDEEIKSTDTTIDTEDTEHEESAEDNLVEAETRSSFYPSCVTEVNMMIKNTPEEEEGDLNDFSKQTDIERETSESDAELVLKMEDDRRQDVTTHFEILTSKETKKSDKKFDNFSEIEQHARSRPQALRRVFRGDSRDSGIGDCSSGQVTFSLQVDEQGIVSIIEEEVDHETRTRENKRTPTNEETRRDVTTGILMSPAQGRNTPSGNTGSATDDGKVATKSGVTKASCETNSVRKVTGESTDARISGRNTRDKYLPTGNVSRTARMFESGTPKVDSSQLPAEQRVHPTAIVTGKSHNERIQKAFAFWNK